MKKGNRFSSKKNEDHRRPVAEGILKIYSGGFGFVITDNPREPDIFIPEHSLRHAMHGDRVRVTIKKSHGKRLEGFVVHIVERANAIMIGQLHRYPMGWKVLSRDGGRPFEIDLIMSEQTRLHREGDIVAVRITRYAAPGIEATGEVVQVLGQKKDLPTLTNAVLLRRQIIREFPSDVRQQCQDLPEVVEHSDMSRDRKDITHLPLITIDGITARDFDDAVCARLDGRDIILTVAIADVAEYVRTGGGIDQDAYKRSVSTYLARTCIPMLPEKLSNGLCSLKEGELRFVLVCEMRFSDRGIFKGAAFFKGLMRSRKRATYEEVQEYYDGKGSEYFTDSAVSESLVLMQKLAIQLQKKSRERGALDLDLPETRTIMGDDGRVSGFTRAQRVFSHRLIEEFMISANVAVAALFEKHGLPQLYRVHDQPDPTKMQAFLDMLKGVGIRMSPHDVANGNFLDALSGHRMAAYLKTVYLRSMKQAQYDPENRGHYGLSLGDYCHFTSPIRRYPDLVVHRQLRAIIEETSGSVVYLDKNRLSVSRHVVAKMPYTFRDLVAIGRHTSRRERESAEAEREVLDLEKIFFMQDFIGNKYQGRISRMNRYGFFVELDNPYIEGWLPIDTLPGGPYEYDEKRIRISARRNKRMFRIGDRLDVILRQIDVDSRKIEMGLVT